MSVELEGAVAPPMANGELVFEEPWQGRVFGMARALADAGVYSWDDFRERLIEAVAVWDREGTGPYAYYDCFLVALENLLVERDVLAPQQLSSLLAELNSRPHGHDH